MEEVPAVPPLLVVLLRDPLAPAPLAVADAAPPTPVAWAVAALSSVPLVVALGVSASTCCDVASPTVEEVDEFEEV